MDRSLDELLASLISIHENQLKIGISISTEWEKIFAQCAQVRDQRLGDKFNEPITVYDSITGDPKMFI